MTHWARDVVGKPWSPGGCGPDSFSCWGLVRYAFQVKFGIELPMITSGEDATHVDQAALKAAAASSGWRPTSHYLPAADDVVVMLSNTRTHVGIVERANFRTGVLHCSHERGVVFEPFRDATFGMTYTLWRRIQK